MIAERDCGSLQNTESSRDMPRLPLGLLDPRSIYFDPFAFEIPDAEFLFRLPGYGQDQTLFHRMEFCGYQCLLTIESLG
jgi:hypothetical protein